MKVFIDKKASCSARYLHAKVRSALENKNIETRIGNTLWHVEGHILKTLEGEPARMVFWLKAPECLVGDIIMLNASTDGKSKSIAITDCFQHDGTFKPTVLAELRFQALALALDRESRTMRGVS